MSFEQSVKEKIDKATIISFDIFETSVIRTLIGRSNFYSAVNFINNNQINDFSQKRIQAEVIARNNSSSEEVTLEEIYKNLSFRDEKQKERYLSTEIKLELATCIPNPDINKIYNYCKKLNKNIIFTTDMYLDRKIINKILKECGYDHYSKLYISSETKMKKSTGSLYDHIINDIDINSEKVLHIGNSYKSDYLMAKSRKLRTQFYRYKEKKNLQTNSLAEALIYGFVNKKCRDNNFYYQFGYKYLGPAIYGYVSWILEQLRESKINRVYFFAREGKFIKKAFDCLNHPDITEKYVYVSRRSLTVPALATINDLDSFTAFRPFRDQVTVKEELGKLGLSEKDLGTDFFNDYVLLNRKFESFNKKDKKNIELRLFKLAKENAKKEAKIAIDYLKQENFEGKFAIVDIGWNGSMQRAIQQILSSQHLNFDMTGYFLAQRDEYYKNQDYINNKGFLFDYGKVSQKENLLLNSGTNFLELLFSADHGSTLKYKKENNKIIPILDKYEYTKILPIIEKIQKAAIDFINDYLNSNDGFKIKKLQNYFLPFYEVLRNPSYKVINKFGDIDISDMNESQKLASKLSGLQYRELISEFKKSSWKVAFLKRNLHTNHAFEIYSILRTIYKGR